MKKLNCLILVALLACTVSTVLAEDGSESTPEPAPCAHIYGEGVVTVNPTCGQAGVKTYTCTLCGETKTEALPAAGEHSWNGGAVSQAPTCQAEGTRTFTCTVCGGTKTEGIAIDPSAHSYGAWNSGQAGTHTRSCACGATESAAHSFDVTATVPATCQEEGATAYGCSACGRIEYEIIPKLTTHTYDNDCDAECNVCGFTREAAHKFSTAWSKDGMNHWHACTKCGEKTDVKKHVPGPAATEEKAQLCLTCGYVLTQRLKHTHTFAAEYASDETGHWYACSGCEEQKDFEEHVYDNPCDPDCNICGYVTETAHTPDAQWNTDEGGHWHICADCGVFFQYAAHLPGENGQCSVCGFALASTEEPHEHAGSGEWLTDEKSHWKLCECGEETGKEAHIWKESKNPKTFTCTVCGVEKAPVGSRQGSSLGIVLMVLIAVVVLAVVAFAVLLVLWKKPPKKPGKFAR